MKVFSNLLCLGLLRDVEAHAGLMDPPPWMDAGGQFFPTGDRLGSCQAGCREWNSETHTMMGCNCYWFQNWTLVPDSVPLQITGSSPFATYGTLDFGGGPHDHCAKHRYPWTAPGKAPIDSPCGMDGGNPRGCWTGNGYALNDPIYQIIHGKANMQKNVEVPCGGGSYKTPTTNGQLNDARLFPFHDIQSTTVMQGGVLRTAWGIIANHGGGYAFRLCKLEPGMTRADVTEECFQAGHLHFIDDMSEIQKEKETPLVIPVQTFQGDTGPWRKNPIPACGGTTEWSWVGGAGSHAYGCPTWFPPPVQAPELYGFGYGDNYEELLKWNVVDKLRIPEDLAIGSYVLSFRYDSMQGPQVWSACSNIEVVAGPAPPTPPRSPSPAAVTTTTPLPDAEALNCKIPISHSCGVTCCNASSVSPGCGDCGTCQNKAVGTGSQGTLCAEGCHTWCQGCYACYNDPAPEEWDAAQWGPNCKMPVSNGCKGTCCNPAHNCGDCGNCIGKPDDALATPGTDTTCAACRQWCGACTACYNDPPVDVTPTQPAPEPESEPEPQPEPQPESEHPETTGAPTTPAPTTPEPATECTEANAETAICGDPERYIGSATITWPDRSTTCDAVVHNEGGWLYASNRCASIAKWCCSEQELLSTHRSEPRHVSGLHSVKKHVGGNMVVEVGPDGGVAQVTRTKFADHVTNQRGH